MNDIDARSRRARVNVVVGATVLGTAALLVLAWVVGGRPGNPVALAILCALAATSWFVRQRAESGRDLSFSLTSVVLVAAAALVGPVGAGIVGFAATIVPSRPRQPFVQWLFNLALSGALGLVGGLAFHWVRGGAPLARDLGAGELIVGVGLAIALVDVLQCLTNVVLVSGVLWAATGVRFRNQMLRMLTATGPVYVGYGVIGFVYAVLWVPAGVGAFATVLVMPPLLAAQWAYAQYGEEQQAHERTMNALVSAVQLKDPGATGHLLRVASLSRMVAEASGIGANRVEAVSMAGMLHDVGTLTVPNDVLRQADTVEGDDLDLVLRHGEAGALMLEGIEFLEESRAAVRHHHERWDGRGYPDGLAGEAIPVGARIVALAEAYEVLTSGHEDRPALSSQAALVALAARAGTEFDPALLPALASAVRLEGSSPTGTPTEQPEHAPRAKGGAGHDEPGVSERIAVRLDARRARTGSRAAAHTRTTSRRSGQGR
ncbi:HD-GYP domain-containing protein [Janibacter sp. G1551]|uniref:HD-GYP domain-containing protein n=1 Tax=Janibacter sp. G1551 TaxID=3420440 RepID=UPI003D06EB0B